FLTTSSLTLLPPSGSFGVTKKAKAGRLGVSGRPLFFYPIVDPRSRIVEPTKAPSRSAGAAFRYLVSAIRYFTGLPQRVTPHQAGGSCRKPRTSTSLKRVPCRR